jgi:CBS domain-containing membrane protein
MSRAFGPILAGASARDRLIACIGALVGIGITGLMCSLAAGHGLHLPLLVAPMGASAVLLFAVPSSPLAQPWAIIGGNTISAAVGISIARLVPDPMLAAGLAVGAAIAAMSLTRCLHPPGGAVALIPVIGGAQIAAAGYWFVLEPVGLNALLLTILGYCFHRFTRHAYPHVPIKEARVSHDTRNAAPNTRVGFNAEDVDAALRDLGETFDIDREDLDRLLQRVELRALERSHGELCCLDIMSRDIVRTRADADQESARTLLIDHDLLVLPVVDDMNRVLGCVGFRELIRPGRRVGDSMSGAWIALPRTRLIDLIAPLTDGEHRVAVIVDEDRRLLGVVTQTDLLASLGRPAVIRDRSD